MDEVTREQRRQRVRSMRRWRITISTIAVVLGIVLVATGHVLVGLVLGGLAAARLVMFARFPIGGRDSHRFR